MKNFDELGIDSNIIKAIGELGFESPMPIQEQVIPHLLKEEPGDIVALAQTGTGKTAAFGIPIIEHTDPSLKRIQHLVLAPTRELCLQIADDLTSFCKYKSNLKVAAVFGGASMDRQVQMIKKGAQIISATPGRLLDLINRGFIDISRVKTVVLDEADEMLNMGFRDDLEEILKNTPGDKNTLLFSATMPEEVMLIAKRYMHKPTEFTVGKKNTGAINVNHICYMVHAKDRYLALKRIVDFHPNMYGIVFCRTRRETQEVADLLIEDGYNADALHGDLSQIQRDSVMNKFRIKHLKMLVATDVAARGIDVDNLTHIVNYNLPDELEIYTHRSGRTGRAGKTGTSIAIANMKEKGKLKQIEKILDKKFEFLPVPMGKDICEKQLFHLIDRMEKVEVDYSQIESYLPNIYKKLEWLDREELIKKFVSLEFNRFLDYYRNAKDLNAPTDRGNVSRKDRNARVEGFTRFFINLGNLDQLKPTQLIGLINDTTGKRDIEIGEIDIKKSFSFFELDSAFTDLVLRTFEGTVYNDRDIKVEVAEKKKTESSRGDGGRRRAGRKTERRRDKERSSGGRKSYGKKDASLRSDKFSGTGNKKSKDDKPKRSEGKRKKPKAWRNK
jgi:ATP-dependent RNA helicase DeaD